MNEETIKMMEESEGVIVGQEDVRVSVSLSQVELSKEMRKLWEDQIVWTRMTIITMIDEVPDNEKAIARLLRNPYDIGAVFGSYYSVDFADKVSNLLSTHLTLTADTITAAKAGDETRVDDLEKRWYQNAEEIAANFSVVNPNWHQDALAKLLHEYITLTKSEVEARLKGDYETDISAYEAIHNQILLVADSLTEGIVTQFPEKFKN